MTNKKPFQIIFNEEKQLFDFFDLRDEKIFAEADLKHFKKDSHLAEMFVDYFLCSMQKTAPIHWKKQILIYFTEIYNETFNDNVKINPLKEFWEFTGNEKTFPYFWKPNRNEIQWSKTVSVVELGLLHYKKGKFFQKYQLITKSKLEVKNIDLKKIEEKTNEKIKKFGEENLHNWHNIFSKVEVKIFELKTKNFHNENEILRYQINYDNFLSYLYDEEIVYEKGYWNIEKLINDFEFVVETFIWVSFIETTNITKEIDKIFNLEFQENLMEEILNKQILHLGSWKKTNISNIWSLIKNFNYENWSLSYKFNFKYFDSLLDNLKFYIIGKLVVDNNDDKEKFFKVLFREIGFENVKKHFDEFVKNENFYLWETVEMDCENLNLKISFKLNKEEFEVFKNLVDKNESWVSFLTKEKLEKVNVENIENIFRFFKKYIQNSLQEVANNEEEFSENFFTKHITNQYVWRRFEGGFNLEKFAISLYETFFNPFKTMNNFEIYKCFIEELKLTDLDFRIFIKHFQKD